MLLGTGYSLRTLIFLRTRSAKPVKESLWSEPLASRNVHNQLFYFRGTYCFKA